MTNRLLLAAGLGCLFCKLPVLAQSSTNSLARNADAITTLLSEPIDFCGESLPVDQPAVTHRWRRMLSRQAALASSLVVLKRRAQAVFPLIEPILKQYRIPSDFKYLPLLESAVTNRAVSRRGAAGFWQLMPHTAQSLGLRVSGRTDERFNLQKATHAACRYIRQLYQQLGSWMLTASAYNAGPSYIQQLSRQHPDTHPMALPYRAAETKAYLYQAVAVKELITRPEAYRDHLSNQHFAMLTSQIPATLSLTEQQAILASLASQETAPPALGSPAFVTDSTLAVVLLTDEEDGVPAPSTVAEHIPSTVTAHPAVDAIGPGRLATRSLSEGPLSEGQLCVFQVIQPLTLNGWTFAVGDLIHAHVELINTTSGQVFLRTDRLITAQTQETIPLRMIATGEPHHPGVPLPPRLDGWGLNWEVL
ncbi:lytic transglycosylase domain-containing protein [Spirosoma sp. 209]|uniref:lytic transglycosylase domain-containing protein n=1 Tax=Spirosoma sp. 209 TaxID=1955701 RepID=UPI00098D6B40|nr:lytic transglycosylase domain-containing protein [Spirosoma sp. 209]